MSVYPEGVEVVRTASISDDGLYRYSLGRSWAAEGEQPRTLAFVMLNPSTADAARDDNTIRRCVGLARSHQYTGIHVVNLFALRATKPAVLWEKMDAGFDVVGENDSRLATIFALAYGLDRPVVAAWGAAPKARKRIAEVYALPYADQVLHAFKLTTGGMPWHPLYLPIECELTPWKMPET